MTDDKGAGEGPYRKITHYTKFETRDSRIDAYGDGVKELDVSDGDGWGILRLVNSAYAEGRKSKEKDLQELLGLSQELCDDLGDDVADKFRAWKKARGIE